MAGPVKNRVLCGYFKMVPFPPPSESSIREFFSKIHYENLVELLEAELAKVWGPP